MLPWNRLGSPGHVVLPRHPAVTTEGQRPGKHQVLHFVLVIAKLRGTPGAAPVLACPRHWLTEPWRQRVGQPVLRAGEGSPVCHPVADEEKPGPDGTAAYDAQSCLWQHWGTGRENGQSCHFQLSPAQEANPQLQQTPEELACWLSSFHPQPTHETLLPTWQCWWGRWQLSGATTPSLGLPKTSSILGGRVCSPMPIQRSPWGARYHSETKQ